MHRVLIVTLLLVTLSGTARADKALVMVYLDGQGCPLYTRTNEKNCDQDREHLPDRSCRGPGQRIWWEVSDKTFAEQIEVVFDKGDADPLNADCSRKAKNGKITRCRIDGATAQGEYAYSIVVPDKCRLDPKIIVR